MKTTLLNYLLENSSVLTFEQVILNFATVIVLSFCIYISYKYSCSRIVYSARFNASLVMLAIITTLVMSCIGNNVALSLGMVGALSIVRFRTAIKDARDAAYIFWAIAVGICCGVSDYRIAGIGTLYMFIILLVVGNVQNNTRYLLVVRSQRGKANEIKECIDKYYAKKAIFRANNTNKEFDEIIYLVSSNTMKKASKQKETISEKLYAIDGVTSVNTVSQNNEMNS